MLRFLHVAVFTTIGLSVAEAWWGRSQSTFLARCINLRGGNEEELSINVEMLENPGFSEAEYEGLSQEEEPQRFEASSHRASDHIVDLSLRTGDRDDGSQDLRVFITERTASYTEELYRADESTKLPEPRKLLHTLARKVPAIKRSPDVALRIQASSSDLDCGLAACIIGTMGRVSELYDKVSFSRSGEDIETPMDIVNDRRFEQLVECIMCGVDMRKASEEGIDESLVFISESDTGGSAGLSVRDACRAAWGIAVLGVHRDGSIGGQNVFDILSALSLQIRDGLLAKLHNLQQGDLLEVAEGDASTIGERIDYFSQELAEDAASALWTLACVKACTGANYSATFELCAQILCQDPYDFRRQGQKIDSVVETMTVGSNDIVERLAEAEAKEEAAVEKKLLSKEEDAREGTNAPMSTAVEDSQRLLDWLAPQELTDSVWAIALHGMDEVTIPSSSALNLTGNVNTYCDLAFDCLVHRLRDEVQHQQHTSEDVPRFRCEAMEFPDSIDGHDPSAIEGDSEQIVKPYTDVEEPTMPAFSVNQTDPLLDSNDQIREYGEGWTSDEATEGKEGTDAGCSDASPVKETPEFLPSDLCTLAWAATEINGLHSSSVSQLVTRVFSHRGQKSLDGLSGGDLSNLAWAIAKHAANASVAITSHYPSALIAGWIAEYALDCPGQGDTSLPVTDILHRFQPPQLSRLLWSLAVVLTMSDSLGSPIPAIETLSYHALVAAASNLSLFGAEDLARISWAFLVLNAPARSLAWPYVPESLGKLLSAIENCILDWEAGKMSSQKNQTDPNADHQREWTRFASFFGRSRFHLPFLDQNTEEDFDESDEANSLALSSKSRLPLLSDLPVDPLTLCKVTLAFSVLSADELYSFQMSDKLLRSSMRLLTSRNARLMRECPLPDLARLLEAAALCNARECRELIGFFVRKALHLINELQPDEFGYTDLKSRPDEVASLLWSLGKLGCAFSLLADERSTAHRKLHLVAKVRLVDRSSIGALPIESAVKLLDGLSTTRLALYDKDYVSYILQHLEGKIATLKDETVFCSLIETLGMLKTTLDEDKRAIPADTQLDGNATSAEPSEEPVFQDGTDRPTDSLVSCEQLIFSIGEAMAPLLSAFSISGIRRALQVFIRLPCSCDVFVDAVEREIISREELLDNEIDLEAAAHCASSMLLSLKDSLSSGSDSSSHWSLSNFQRLFDRSGTEREEERDDVALEEGMSASGMDMEQFADLLSSTSASLERLREVLATPRDSPIKARFEFSRCKEEIEQYRRNDFSEGIRSSRLDKQRRHAMTKRVLSRLLPP